ncbi:hypothetical protein GH733_010948 [Mirounga leonina]|nr:hypothetical protein GH733_010948 [Mirounga leonina]
MTPQIRNHSPTTKMGITKPSHQHVPGRGFRPPLNSLYAAFSSANCPEAASNVSHAQSSGNKPHTPASRAVRCYSSSSLVDGRPVTPQHSPSTLTARVHGTLQGTNTQEMGLNKLPPTFYHPIAFRIKFELFRVTCKALHDRTSVSSSLDIVLHWEARDFWSHICAESTLVFAGPHPRVRADGSTVCVSRSDDEENGFEVCLKERHFLNLKQLLSLQSKHAVYHSRSFYLLVSTKEGLGLAGSFENDKGDGKGRINRTDKTIGFKTVGAILGPSSMTPPELVSRIRTPLAVNWVGENICQKTLAHIGTIMLYIYAVVGKMAAKSHDLKSRMMDFLGNKTVMRLLVTGGKEAGLRTTGVGWGELGRKERERKRKAGKERHALEKDICFVTYGPAVLEMTQMNKQIKETRENSDAASVPVASFVFLLNPEPLHCGFHHSPALKVTLKVTSAQWRQGPFGERYEGDLKCLENIGSLSYHSNTPLLGPSGSEIRNTIMLWLPGRKSQAIKCEFLPYLATGSGTGGHGCLETETLDEANEDGNTSVQRQERQEIRKLSHWGFEIMLLNWSKENQLLAEYSGCREEIRPQTRDVSSSAEQLVKFCGRRAGVTSWRVGGSPSEGMHPAGMQMKELRSTNGTQGGEDIPLPGLGHSLDHSIAVGFHLPSGPDNSQTASQTPGRLPASAPRWWCGIAATFRLLTVRNIASICNMVSSKDEDFLDLSVTVEQNTSVTHCLRDFSNTEQTYYRETRCSEQEAQKRMRVKKLPMILALHLEWFKYMEQLHRYTTLSLRCLTGWSSHWNSGSSALPAML